MTDDEFSIFNRALMCAFPATAEWINRNSPDPKATQAYWRQTLRACSLEECYSVLNDWIEGRQQPPNQYELQRTALLIRDSVMADRDKDTKRRDLNERAATYEQRKAAVARRRAGYEALPKTGSMLSAIDAGKAVMARLKTGELTRDEASRLVDAIVEGVE